MPTTQLPRRSIRLITSGIDCQVKELLGEGGEGRVHRVVLSRGGEFALKWYHTETATPMRRRALQKVIAYGPPNDRFLWPVDLAGADGVSEFGYIMRLREARFHGMIEHMYRRVTPRFRELVTAGVQLADCFLQLHAKGLCYRDISFGNVFFDPTNGDVLVCDNDNVGVDEEEAGILGTHYFMAPEILRREAMPSTRTDRFSLAVLLFYMFLLHHPFDGRRQLSVECLDELQMVRLFGLEPVFIFDPHDESNRPVPGEQDNPLVLWPLYPKFVRDLFTRAFTEGARDPCHGRVTEGEWRRALVRLRDTIVTCAHCGEQSFWQADTVTRCCNPACRLAIPQPSRLVLGSEEVVLSDGNTLYPHHLDRRRFDFSVALARVSRHPTYDLTGLSNLSERTWVVTSRSDLVQEVRPRQTVRIEPGMRVDFGLREGEIRM